MIHLVTLAWPEWICPIQCQIDVYPIYQDDANLASIHCQSNVNQNPILITRSSIHCQSIANFMLFRCQSWQSCTNPCQSVANLMSTQCRSYANSLPIRCQFSANPVPLQSSSVCYFLPSVSSLLAILDTLVNNSNFLAVLGNVWIRKSWTTFCLSLIFNFSACQFISL